MWGQASKPESVALLWHFTLEDLFAKSTPLPWSWRETYVALP
jgi:hypothetical protein